MSRFSFTRIVLPVIVLGFPIAGFCTNPFSSISTSSSGANIQPSVVTTKELDPEKHPLVRWPLENYVIMGILLSENKSVAIVRTPPPHSQTYLLRFGDLLGDEDGLVRKIDNYGISIVVSSSDEPKEKRLEGRNRGVQTKDE